MITVDIVNFEEKSDLVVQRFPSELVYGVQKFLKRYRAGVVFVEYLEDPLREEWLKNAIQMKASCSPAVNKI